MSRTFVPPPFVTTPRRPEQPIGVAIGHLVPAVSKKAFERFGFPAAALLTQWADIAGLDLAQCSEPERLKWSQRREGEEDAEDAGTTLVLRVEPSRALDVQYRQRQIIERINAYFGFRAVARLRIVQAPLTPRSTAKSVRRPPAPPIAIDGVADSALKEALSQLGGNVRAKASRSAG